MRSATPCGSIKPTTGDNLWKSKGRRETSDINDKFMRNWDNLSVGNEPMKRRRGGVTPFDKAGRRGRKSPSCLTKNPFAERHARTVGVD